MVSDAHQRSDHGMSDTLLESLWILCRINGIAITRDALSAGLPLKDGKLTPALFKRAADRAHLVSRVLKKPLQSLQ